MIQNMQEILGFSDKEIALASHHKQLLSLEVELGSRCNLHCEYCYSGKDLFRKNELGLEELFDAISQAKALGARKIIYIGAGEPLLDTKLKDIVHYVNKLGLKHVLFTNAILINKEIADYFFEQEVCVFVKYPSAKEELFDRLAGCHGAFASMKRGLKFLQEAGYPDEKHALGVESIVCSYNIKEIPDVWQWARNNKIIPYVECITRKGSAIEHSDLFPTKEATRDLFEILAKIDNDKYGIYWKACPPIAGFSCKRHLYSCTLNSQGYIQPCVGIDLKIGNIRTEKLASILRNSKVLRELSQIRTNIKGVCKTCEFHNDCYGCRGNAYNLAGDYLASDPTCWRIKNEAITGNSSCKK
ncbi:MAG: radical SAM/SPASM domain-containing protein [Candidatus Omnitrophica bacterium CG_4_10_14_0_2_um_filter_44_9]|nr:MAG: hypothetical protein AUJ70_04115 [Candidatus Omnitrophica bacterium CG1_02_40_15]PIY81960.1 MAG: radical SAM/SPASM domain-containing protein [Candidatus Omnitrophica bacterium CG_4_10_14_0_8_um_filter_44_12]PIZ83790.1 MAG: radical SAM/SPASM domain-containing protein [Candidatus Omnitrophica bacterium CG_4_10_14_0_2_um_filter_44_9]